MKRAVRLVAIAWLASGCVTYDSVGEQPGMAAPPVDRPLSCFLPSPCPDGTTCGELVLGLTPNALFTRAVALPVPDSEGRECDVSSSAVCSLRLAGLALPRYADRDDAPAAAELDGLATALDDCGRYRVETPIDSMLIEIGGGDYAITIERLGFRSALVPAALVRDDWSTAVGLPLLDGGAYVMPAPPRDAAGVVRPVRYVPVLEGPPGTGTPGTTTYLAYRAGDRAWRRGDLAQPSTDGGVVIVAAAPGVYRRRFRDRETHALLCPAGGLPGLVALARGRVFLDVYESGRDLEPCAF